MFTSYVSRVRGVRRLHRAGRSALWRNHDFLRLWSAETVAQFGSQIGLVAIPLIAAIAVDASAMQMGMLAAAGSAPHLALGFFAGPWVDRLPRRPIMIWTDAGRALTSAVIPIAALADLLSFELLVLVSVLGGRQSVFFNAAWSATVPHLVNREHLNEANGKLISSYSLAQVSGPAIGGTLVSWLTGPVTMWIQAATFAASSWFIARIQKPEAPRERPEHETPHFWREMREGIHALVSSRLVLPLTTSSAVLNLGGSIFLAVYVLYMTDDLGLSSRGVGLVFAAGGAGSLAGSLLASPLATSIGVGRSILWGAIGFSVFSLFVPLAILTPSIALPLVVIAEFGAWATLQVYNVNRFSLRQALTPEHLLGRVSSSTMTIIGGMQMFGAIIGGVIGEVFSIHTALIVGSVGMFIAAWWVWDSPIPSLRTLPDEPEETLRHVVDEAPATS